MPLTVSWPTISSSQVSANGIDWPARARRRIVPIMARYDIDGRPASGGSVASHGPSQSALSRRSRCHVGASRRRSGRTPTCRAGA